MLCTFEWKDEANKIVECTTCGRMVETRQTDLKLIRRICNAGEKPENGVQLIPKVTPPPTITRVKNFTKAAVAHFTAGSPTCTQEEIDARFEICKACPLFISKNDGVGVCGHQNCGCNITNTITYLNKLGWADQKCPIDKWGTIEKKEDDTKNS